MTNWKEIHKDFKDESNQKYWKKHGFNYQITKEWKEVLGESFEVNDWAFYVWLRDEKRLTAQEVRQKDNLKNLKQRYNKVWADIHPDFAKQYDGKTYQQKWEEIGFTYSEAQQLVRVGFEPSDYYQVNQWKEQGFDPQTIKLWIEIGFNFSESWNAQQWRNSYLDYEQIRELIELGFELNDYSTFQNWKNQNFAISEIREWIASGLRINDYQEARQLKSLNFTPQQAKSWKSYGLTYEEIRNWIGSGCKPEEANFADYLKKNKLSVSVESRNQYWLDTHYPLDARKEITFLDISNRNLGGPLKIEGFDNLQVFICSNNKINSLNLDYQSQGKLTRLDCSYNQISKISGISDNQNNYNYYNNNNYSNLENACNLEKFIANNNCFGHFPNFPNKEKLIHFDMRNNPLNSVNLEFFSQLPNLEVLMIGIDELQSTAYYGTFLLKSLRNLTNLKRLHINRLSSTSDLEYLPESLENFSFQGCSQIEEKLKNYGDSLPNWRKAQNYYNLFQESGQKLEERQKEIISLQEQLESGEKVRSDLKVKLRNKHEELEQLQIKNSSYQQFVKDLLENEKISLEELVQQAKDKLGEIQEWLETFFQTYKELAKNQDNSFAKEQVTKIQNILNKKLTEEEIQGLLAKQKELLQLEKQLAKFQISEEQTAQILHNPPKIN